jgi:hypothetical protein
MEKLFKFSACELSNAKMKKLHGGRMEESTKTVEESSTGSNGCTDKKTSTYDDNGTKTGECREWICPDL